MVEHYPSKLKTSVRSRQDAQLKTTHMATPQWISSNGILVYEPFRARLDNKNWCVIEADKELTRYYRDWLRREKHIYLEQPSWDAHVSIIRGEKLKANSKNWKVGNRQPISFIVDHSDIQVIKDKDQPGYFYCMSVESVGADQIRLIFGLPVSYKYHITIGRTHY